MTLSSITDQPLAIVFYPDAAALEHSLYASQLVGVVNAAFRERTKDYLRVDPRVADLPGLMSELGRNTIAYVVASVPTTAAEEPVVYGMGSAQPFDPAHGVGPDGIFDLWRYVTPPGEDLTDVQRWEIKIVVTEPRFQGHGLATLVMDMLEREIGRRVRKQRKIEKQPCRKCQLILTTIKDVNEGYYNRLGYRTVSEMPVPKGSFKIDGVVNKKTFTIASMNRFLNLD